MLRKHDGTDRQSIASHGREARNCPLYVLQVVEYKAD